MLSDPAPTTSPGASWSGSNALAKRAPILLCLVTALGLGISSANGGFVYDSHLAVERNVVVLGEVPAREALERDLWGRPLGKNSLSYRPTIVLVWRALWAMGGGSPLAYRLASALIHLAVCLLFFVLVRRLGRGRVEAYCALALFSVHGLHAEALGAIVAQADLLSALFGLAALILLTGERRQLAATATALPLLALAMLSKETGVVFAAIALAWLVAGAGGAGRWRALWASLIFAGVVAFVLLNLWIPRGWDKQGFNSLVYAADGMDRLLLGLYFIGRGAATALFPFSLAPNHGYAAIDLSSATLLPFALPGAGVLFLGVVAGVHGLRLRSLPLLACCGLFLGPLVIISGLFVPTPTDLPERALYPVTMAACCMIAAGLVRIPSARRALLVAVLVALVGYHLSQRWGAQQSWTSDQALWRHAVQSEPRSIRANDYLARVQLESGKLLDGAWQRMKVGYAATYIPGSLNWEVVDQLELVPLPRRLLVAPAQLNPLNPCAFARRFMALMARDVAKFPAIMGPAFREHFGPCFSGKGSR